MVSRRELAHGLRIHSGKYGAELKKSAPSYLAPSPRKGLGSNPVVREL